jgi:hypothetical protein
LAKKELRVGTSLKILKYFAYNKFMEENLVPSKSLIPDWYKKISPFSETPNILPITTVKKCVPFLDSLTSGYMMTTNQDIQIVHTQNGYQIYYNLDQYQNVSVDLRSEPIRIPAPFGYSEVNHFVWNYPFGFKTPKNYSLLITHPLNRYDLPFITTSGIVDADSGAITGGNLPFFLKLGFSGLIPAGTPFAQITLIKRDSWKKSFDKRIESEIKKTDYNIKRFRESMSFYKKALWKNKFFN